MKRYKKILPTIIFLISYAAAFALYYPAYACTRILHVDPKAVMVGRNMDWYGEMQQQLRVYPRGITRNGMASEGNSLQWISRYGSMVITALKDFTAEGINERGLSVHLLALQESDYGVRQANIPGMSIAMWAQYYLDQFATVSEAVKAASSPGYQLEAINIPQSGITLKLHLAIEDAKGDSAIIEYTNGTPKIFRTTGNDTLTNSPTYDLQLTNLKNYKGFGGDKDLPGTTNSSDRFVRASYYNEHLPLATSLDNEVYSILSIIRNAAQPFGTVDDQRPTMSYTTWQIVGDLTHRIYYYTSTSNPNLVKISLEHFDLDPWAPVMMLDITVHPELSGDVSNQFQPMK